MRTMLFVCPHGAGKSRMAAAFFNRVAPDGWRAISAGQEPADAVNPDVVRLLDGSPVEALLDRESPRPITAVPTRERIIAIDCDVPGAARWDLRTQEITDLMRDELQERAEALARKANLSGTPEQEREPGSELGALTGYFLKLGTLGFGGPVALAGYMQRDLVEERRWVSDEDYKLAFALAQISPGPMAAQLAIALGYFTHGVRGATAIGVAFVLPSFVMVLALATLYVAFGGLWWMQALFYGIGAAVIGIIAIAAYKLARKINGRDPLLWGIFLMLAVTTVWAQAELAQLFLISGLLVLLVHAPPRWLKSRLPFLSVTPGFLLVPPVSLVAFGSRDNALSDIFLFFVKAGAFVFGSGLAIVPFLYTGIVEDRGWLSEQEFIDAVAVAMITPGPVVITVAFIGYLVAGVPGAVVAAVAIFVPVYVLTIIPAPWFKRHRDNVQLRAFADGATAAASGAIAGAVVVLAQRAVVDIPTGLIAVVSLVVLWRFKVPEPLLVLAAGGIGLALWPIVG